MIAALVAILFLGGGGVVGYFYDLDSIEKKVKDAVVDDTRRDAALDVLDAAEDRVEEYGDSLSDLADEFYDQLQVKGAAKANVDERRARFSADLNSFQDDIIDLRTRLKAQMTREEWAQVFPPE